MIGIIWFGIARFIYFYHQRTQISFVDAFVDVLRCRPADDVGLNLSLGSQGRYTVQVMATVKAIAQVMAGQGYCSG